MKRITNLSLALLCAFTILLVAQVSAEEKIQLNKAPSGWKKGNSVAKGVLTWDRVRKPFVNSFNAHFAEATPFYLSNEVEGRRRRNASATPKEKIISNWVETEFRGHKAYLEEKSFKDTSFGSQQINYARFQQTLYIPMPELGGYYELSLTTHRSPRKSHLLKNPDSRSWKNFTNLIKLEGL